MTIRPFLLERYFAQYEFKVQHLLSPSDCEAFSLSEMLLMADDECRNLWDSLRLGYTESAGAPLLRREIANLYTGLSAEQILVAAPEEAILLAMQATLHPGDHVISIFPAYQSLYEIARSIGCEVSHWHIQLEGNTWQLDFRRLTDLLQPNTRMLIVNFPHNPTGFLPEEQLFRQIVEFAGEHQLYLFSDEMYRLLEYREEERLPAACELYEEAFSLGGVSKAFALPGLRIGWLATQSQEALNRCAVYKDYTTICSSAPSEILAIIALRNRPAILRRNLSIISSNILTADQFFRRHPRFFSWFPPQAGSVALARWEGGLPLEEVCRRLLDEKGLMILPGAVFEIPGDTFRLGLGRLTFSQALDRLETWISETF